MFVVQIWCLYLVNRLLYSVLPETTFLTKTAEHDFSFDLYNFWHWVTSAKCFRRCVELMPGEVLKISKRYSQPNLSYWRKTNRGSFGPPIRSRVNHFGRGKASDTRASIIHILPYRAGGVGVGVGVGRSRLFFSESESESTKSTDSDRLRANSYSWFTEIAMPII